MRLLREGLELDKTQQNGGADRTLRRAPVVNQCLEFAPTGHAAPPAGCLHQSEQCSNRLTGRKCTESVSVLLAFILLNAL